MSGRDEEAEAWVEQKVVQESAPPEKCRRCCATDCPGGRVCDLQMRVNSLSAALRKQLMETSLEQLKNDKRAQFRAICLVLEEYGSDNKTSCPVCEKPHVVNRGVVVVHFAAPTDMTPCPASFKTCVAGFLL